MTLAATKRPAPSLIELGFVAYLIASKHYSVDLVRVDDFLTTINTWKIKTIEKLDIFLLEEHLLKTIDFDIQVVTPIDFLYRYVHIYGDHLESSEDPDSYRRTLLAGSSYLCQLMLYSADFMACAPS